MIFRPFYYFDRGCASYLFGCGTLNRCAVVDARADDVTSYIAFASSKNMRITHVIDTHVHADHRSGGPDLACRTGAEYCLHESADYDGRHALRWRRRSPRPAGTGTRKRGAAMQASMKSCSRCPTRSRCTLGTFQGLCAELA